MRSSSRMNARQSKGLAPAGVAGDFMAGIVLILTASIPLPQPARFRVYPGRRRRHELIRHQIAERPPLLLQCDGSLGTLAAVAEVVQGIPALQWKSVGFHPLIASGNSNDVIHLELLYQSVLGRMQWATLGPQRGANAHRILRWIRRSKEDSYSWGSLPECDGARPNVPADLTTEV